MKRILLKAINPLRILINDSRFTGLMLIACTILSMCLANSGFAAAYKQFWHGDLVTLSSIPLPENFLSWINNFLMAFFFLMAGMEIKRELVSGELSSFKKAVLPFGAALGGMTVPALIFVAFNLHTSYTHGWGIPTATDIAFSVGIASLLGKRIPVGLKILLMALAIIDDLGAIVVIALFYGGHINWLFLGIGGLLYAALFAVNYAKIKFGPVQIVLSLALWYAFFNSGIESSIVGVLVAFATPVAELPKIEKAIHRWVNFLIIPLFALANTAILLPDHIIGSLGTTVGLGIIFGLVIGKPIGIFLFSRILVACKVASLPSNVQWKQVFGMGTLAGIGFTMSIFTTMLAFKAESFQDIAKVAILVSVLLSLIFSMAYFLIISVNMKFEHAGETEQVPSTAEGKLELELG
ncbi:Na+/H+ antiporter NhaA [Mucilaginibacter sp. cycad4]|uniref:Na+/H+ antiporter NhaA n=1 Tax=Mucilaginibacter sp. cycad4 TaxID=3342096 RepID=UPI002AABCA78|nr:Na+/H+ antiporter NhaA [Mucilaginibacter gossypii]WPU97804.1 Na+/H+ antiporter NhaA [Mucilaginibacter gossypii]